MTDVVPAPVPSPVPAPVLENASIAEFKRLEFKVGKILDAADHPDAKRLLVLKVDLGGEVRQVVAGIKEVYDKAALPGRLVVVVANLAPAVIRGVESQGMVLAADLDGKAVLLAPDREVAPGSKVR